MKLWEAYKQAHETRAANAQVAAAENAGSPFSLAQYNSQSTTGVWDTQALPSHVANSHNRGLFASLVGMRAVAAAGAIVGVGGLDGFQVKSISGQNVREDVDVHHPWTALIRCPNQERSPFTVWKWAATTRDFMGTADFLIVRDSLNVPVVMFEIFPEFGDLRPVANGVGGVDYYVFWRADGDKMRFEIEDVIRISRQDPISPYNTASLLRYALATLDKQLYSDLYERDTLREGRFPPVILTTEQPLSVTQMKEYGAEFKKLYMRAGAHTRDGLPVMGRGLTAKQFSMTADDLALIDSQKLRDDLLFKITGVHPGLMSESATEANAKAARRVFYETTVQAEVIEIASVMTLGFTRAFGADPGALEIVAPNVVPVDEELQTTINSQRLLNGEATINDLRREKGVDEIPGGDEVLINSSLMPLSMLVAT